MLNIFTISIATFSLIVLYQIYRFIIRPKSQLEFYRSQGLSVNFTPFSGFLKQCAVDIAKNKDLLYSFKQVNTLNPKPRAFCTNLGQYPVVALKDPELIKQFYINQEKYYIKAPAAIDLPKLILRNGTLLSEGEIWKQHRKLSNVLYNYDAVKDRIPEITQIIDEQLEKLRGKDQIVFLTEVQHILLEVIGKLFLGLDLSQLQFKGQTVSAFVAELIDRSGQQSFEPLTLIFGTDIAKMGILPGHKALVKDIQDLRTFLFGAAKAKLEEILANKDKAPAGKNPLLLQIIYEQMVKMNDSSLTPVDLVDEFASFVLGAMDTTSHALIYTAYYTIENATAQKKVLEEAQRTFQDNSKVTIDSLHQMDYTSAVLKEALRIAPPLPNLLPRYAVQDNTLGDLKIKAGTVVVIGGVTNSFDPDYHDEPDKFMPERWLDENSRTRKSVSKNAYIYLPFSTGARTCPGQHLGNSLVKILVGLLVKKFNVEHSDKNYELIFGSKFFSEPHNPLVYTLKPRK